MKTYLVGGAVRDKLLKLPVTERDWVVVGSTPEAMLKAGFKPVGRDFPVFLHPQTHEEYALARTERKQGRGYQGFEFYTSPEVSLEEDLKRRDLTINAMAEDSEGKIIDPYHGQADLKAGLLRHVSNAFIEDPLRVLRIARFNARFAEFGFHVAPETAALLKTIVDSGELAYLSVERIWSETQKALSEKYPSSFFAVLDECGALTALFPELNGIFTDNIMASLQQAVLLNTTVAVRFASLGSFVAPTELKKFCNRLKVQTAVRDLALAVSDWHAIYALGAKNPAEKQLELFNALDLWRKPALLSAFLLACQSNIQLQNSETLNDFWLKQFECANGINITALIKNYQGSELGAAIRQVRLDSLKTT